MQAFRRGLFALLEIACAFLGGAAIARFTVPDPLVRIGCVVLVAIALDYLIRRRSVVAWGFSRSGLPPTGILLWSVRLLIAGGLPALVIASMNGDGGSMPLTLTGIVVPVLGQEVFLTGYVETRLSDAFGRRTVIALFVLLFMLAHLGHATRSVASIAFIVAMGWQALVWVWAKAKLHTVIPMVIAHAVLLALYQSPLRAAAALAALALVMMIAKRPLLARGARSN